MWDNIQFKVPAGIAASALKVTILDSNSEPIPGYTGLKTNAKGLLDLIGLTVAKTGTNTSTVCAASVVHLPYPKTDLAHTGFDFESWMANAAMFSIAGAILLAAARRRKVTQ